MIVEKPEVAPIRVCGLSEKHQGHGQGKHSQLTAYYVDRTEFFAQDGQSGWGIWFYIDYVCSFLRSPFSVCRAS